MKKDCIRELEEKKIHKIRKTLCNTNHDVYDGEAKRLINFIWFRLKWNKKNERIKTNGKISVVIHVCDTYIEQKKKE